MNDLRRLCDLLTAREIALILQMDRRWRLPAGCARRQQRMGVAHALLGRSIRREVVRPGTGAEFPAAAA